MSLTGRMAVSLVIPILVLQSIRSQAVLPSANSLPANSPLTHLPPDDSQRCCPDSQNQEFRPTLSGLDHLHLVSF